MKVYIKSRYNNTLNQLIPHNHNFADAMYGFLELGAEVVLFQHWDAIKDKITKDDILVDYIDQVVRFLNMFSTYRDIDNYPEELKEYLHRKVWKDTINNFSSDPNKFKKGYFIKPVKEKVFTGRIVSSIKDLIGCGSCYDNYEILVSEPLDIIREWRAFVLYDKIIDVRPYKGTEVTNKTSENLNYWDLGLSYILKDFIKIKDRPVACSIDIATTKEIGQDFNPYYATTLIEVNDCIALGDYGLFNIDYAKMISARQSQVLNKKDEFKF